MPRLISLTLPMATALLMTPTYGAECRSELQAITDEIAVEASNIAGARITPSVRIQDVIQGGVFAAMAMTRANVIIASQAVCGYTRAAQYGIMSHEVGHHVAHRIYPRLQEDSERSSPQIGIMVHEAIADDYAAQILKKLGRYDAAVAEIAARCHFPVTTLQDTFSGNPTACQHLGAWSSE